MQKTLIILKPDAVQRGLIGQIISRLERKGLRVVGAKMILVSRELAGQHYAEHAGKPFYEGLLNFITSSPVLVLAVRGREAVAACRKLTGATDGLKAEPGTIRGDFGISGQMNLVHGSDSPESAERELALWFDESEILEWTLDLNKWIAG